jgi:hypothetical protein
VLATGSLWAIGASLNGIGKTLTVVMPIHGQEADVLRSGLEKQWEAAAVLEVEVKVGKQAPGKARQNS